MARTNGSGQAAPDLSELEQLQNPIKAPGTWLDEPLTTQEVQDNCTIYGILKSKEEANDPEKLLENIAPYLNSLMHLMYILNHEKLGIEAVDGGVKYKGKELYFDIIKYTIDFAVDMSGIENGFKMFMSNALKEIMHSEALSERTHKQYSDFIVNEESTLRRMLLVNFSMDVLRDPEEAILSWTDFRSGNYEKWLISYTESLAKAVAMQFGVDKEQILNPETRTPEQDKAMTEIAGEMALHRESKYRKSNYMQAAKHLVIEKGTFTQKMTGEEEAKKIIKYSVLYFFAQHTEISPEAEAALTVDQLAELLAIYRKMDSYFFDETGGEPIEALEIEKLLYKFVEQDGKTPEEKQEIITTLQAVIPEYHIMPNNALMNTLTSLNAINAGEFDLPVINKRGRRKEITAYTIVNYDQDGAGKLIASKLTEYERQVSDAIISIWVEARKTNKPPEFTTDTIFRAMPGSSDKPSPQQQGAITKVIEKLRHLHIYVDATEEMRVRGLIAENETLVYDDFYLSVARVTRKITNGGQTVRAYHIHTEPLILSYCKMTNQIITVSPKWLEVKKVKKGKSVNEAVSMTQERQAITGYLIRRIAIMKNDRKNKKPTQSDIILFATLFDDIGVTAPDKQKSADIRKFCYDVLEYYKAEKIIADYEQQKKGRSITGVKIVL